MASILRELLRRVFLTLPQSNQISFILLRNRSALRDRGSPQIFRWAVLWGQALFVAAGSTCALDRALVRAGSEANLARASPRFNQEPHARSIVPLVRLVAGLGGGRRYPQPDIMPPHRASPISRLPTAVDVLGSVRAMRCTACGAELALSKVAPDVVRGFEHHSFICSGCHVTEHRLLFMRHGREDVTEPVTVHALSRTAPASTVQAEQIAAPGLFSRMVAKMRGR